MALDPTIPLGVKPIDFLGSAGNLLNLARGAQALEQEQAMNPIQQEKARIDLGIARETQQAEIERQRGVSQQAQTAAQKNQFELGVGYEERMRRVLAGLAETRSFQNILQDPSAALMDVRDAEERLIASGIPKKTAVLMTSSLTSQIADAKRSGDMTPLNNWFYNNIVGSQTPSAQQQLLAPAGTPQVTFGGVPGSVVVTPRGAEFRPTIITPPQPMPAQQMPQQGVQTGGVPLSTDIQQRALNLDLSETAPANKQGPGVPLMQPQAAAPAQPQGVTAGAMTMPAMSYPFRPQGQPFAPLPGENNDFEVGQKYRNGLIAAQPVMTKARRDLEEVVSMADKIEKAAYADSAGVLGAAERKLKSALGNTDYQKLSKDLANARIATIQAKGGSLDTVGGQELVRISNGDETYSPIVLKSVAQRAYGDVIATELEGRAAAAFAQRYGDANHNTFKQTWSKNADSRIFEIMALPKLIQDKSERIKAANEILKNATPKEREEFNRKYQNILRLEQTGSL
jgi:hypothetical protein